MNHTPLPSGDYSSVLDAAVQGVTQSIQHLSSEELHEMMVDDARIRTLIDDSPQLKSLSVEKEMLLAQNKSLAEYNLCQQPNLMAAKEKLAQHYEIVTQGTNEILEKKEKLDCVSESKSLDTTLALLQTAAAQAEEESEAMAELLLEGNVDVDKFVTQFLPKRAEAHIRRIKAEKLNEILQGQRYDTSTYKSRGHAPPVPPRNTPGYPRF